MRPTIHIKAYGRTEREDRKQRAIYRRDAFENAVPIVKFLRLFHALDAQVFDKPEPRRKMVVFGGSS